MGLNMPAKTVVFTSVKKWDGDSHRYIGSGECIQVSGDTYSFVRNLPTFYIHVWWLMVVGYIWRWVEGQDVEAKMKEAFASLWLMNRSKISSLFLRLASSWYLLNACSCHFTCSLLWWVALVLTFNTKACHYSIPMMLSYQINFTFSSIKIK